VCAASRIRLPHCAHPILKLLCLYSISIAHTRSIASCVTPTIPPDEAQAKPHLIGQAHQSSWSCCVRQKHCGACLALEGLVPRASSIPLSCSVVSPFFSRRGSSITFITVSSGPHAVPRTHANPRAAHITPPVRQVPSEVSPRQWQAQYQSQSP
jgi:hypothetical protein